MKSDNSARTRDGPLANAETGNDMRYGFAVAIALSALPISYGAVHSYECDSHPLDDNWILLQNFCDTTEWLNGGRFLQHVEICPGTEPVSGQTATYRVSLAEFEGSGSFFFEWRVEPTGDRSEIPFGGPCGVSLFSFGPVLYWFGISRDQIKFLRDTDLPVPFFEIEAGIPHTFRLELYGDQQYVLFIDDQIVDAGLPEAAYPSSTPRVLMHVRVVHGASTTTWDYFRWGDIAGVFAHGDNLREVELMVAYGMTPRQALAASTYVAAGVLDRANELGRIAEAYLANLIAVRGDPLTNVSVCRKPALVIKGGRIVIHR